MHLCGQPDTEGSIGFGVKDEPGARPIWLSEKTLSDSPSFSCFALQASSKQQVDAFYQAAMTAGGKDNGAPGYRENYHPSYYAAFVLDPDGYNIEAVFHDPEKI